jgi:hypothetical protein
VGSFTVSLRLAFVYRGRERGFLRVKTVVR